MDNKMIDPTPYEETAALSGLTMLYEYMASVCNTTDLAHLSPDQAHNAALAFAGEYHSKLVELVSGQNQPTK